MIEEIVANEKKRSPLFPLRLDCPGASTENKLHAHHIKVNVEATPGCRVFVQSLCRLWRGAECGVFA